MAALEDAMQGWPSESVSPSQLAQPARPETPDATLSKFQEIGKKLNAETEAEGMMKQHQIHPQQEGQV